VARFGVNGAVRQRPFGRTTLSNGLKKKESGTAGRRHEITCRTSRSDETSADDLCNAYLSIAISSTAEFPASSPWASIARHNSVF
jgi:hypothetical protein